MVRKTFGSLSSRNFRLYFFGQIVSNSGTWMQSIAQSLLVLKITGSGVDLGLVSALAFLPVLLFGTAGGLVADRLDKRKLILTTQSLLAMQAAVLGVLTATGVVRLWMVYSLALLMGFINAVDTPARQSFVEQMVGRKSVQNAVSLNSVVMNAARVIGPGIGALLIAVSGEAVCFFVNAGSFGAVVVALLAMDKRTFFPVEPVIRAKGQIKAGLVYVYRTRELRFTLIAVFLVGTFAYNFQVLIPLLGIHTYKAGSGSVGALTSFMGAGAVVGGLAAAAIGKTSLKRLGYVSLIFGVTILALASVSNLVPALIAMLPMGAASITFIALANSNLQLNSDPQMRGRVMALYTVAFLGTTPIGAPLVGLVAQDYGTRVALAMGAVSALISGPILLFGARRRGESRAVDPGLPIEELGQLDVVDGTVVE